MTSERTRRGFLASVGTLASVGAAGCALGGEGDNDVIYQVSTVDTLSGGSLGGVVPVSEIERHGDVGLGTLSGADGEVVVVGGEAYVVRPDGVSRAADTATTPFSVVTDFEPDRTLSLDGTVDFETLRRRLDAELPTADTFLTIRVDSRFEYLQTRSVPEQEPPYPPLAEVIDRETVFEFTNTEATMVGFRFPEYIDGVNVPGYHFHALTEGRDGGGHVYEFELTDPDVAVDTASEFSMVLSDSG